jgi:hypothetical protein
MGALDLVQFEGEIGPQKLFISAAFQELIQLRSSTHVFAGYGIQHALAQGTR